MTIANDLVQVSFCIGEAGVIHQSMPILKFQNSLGTDDVIQ